MEPKPVETSSVLGYESPVDASKTGVEVQGRVFRVMFPPQGMGFFVRRLFWPLIGQGVLTVALIATGFLLFQRPQNWLIWLLGVLCLQVWAEGCKRFVLVIRSRNQRMAVELDDSHIRVHDPLGVHLDRQFSLSWIHSVALERSPLDLFGTIYSLSIKEFGIPPSCVREGDNVSLTTVTLVTHWDHATLAKLAEEIRPRAALARRVAMRRP